jgi:hypothetical protein
VGARTTGGAGGAERRRAIEPAAEVIEEIDAALAVTAP